MKKILQTKKSTSSHWVGDGFPVRSIFSYMDLGKEISPFLLMDYAGPAIFPPTEEIKGVGQHPHRGFETVTIVYSGEVEHRDSSGGGGLITPGDVQWMTAASGLVHEEFHGREFAKKGGAFEMVQIWVNLPKKDKMNKPRYQGIKNSSIPVVDLPNQAGTLRVIAGECDNVKGAALTFSPINLWDVRLKAGNNVILNVPENHSSSVFVLSGQIKIGDKIIDAAEIGVLERKGSQLTLSAQEDTKLLYLGGEVINEPIVGYGPFVMNTEGEIKQAMIDFQNGKMGNL